MSGKPSHQEELRLLSERFSVDDCSFSPDSGEYEGRSRAVYEAGPLVVWGREVSRVDVALDVGCGFGSFTSYLAERACFTVGLDLLQPRLDFAKKKWTLLFTAWVRADSASLPVRDGCVDLVHISYMLQHVTDDFAKQILAEADRILRPAGMLVIIDTLEAEEYWRYLGRFAFMRSAKWYSDALPGWQLDVTWLGVDGGGDVLIGRRSMDNGATGWARAG